MQNQRLANAIGVQSTPSFVIGGELISGAMDLTRFEELISRNSNRSGRCHQFSTTSLRWMWIVGTAAVIVGPAAVNLVGG